jgi:hypothetical protein
VGYDVEIIDLHRPSFADYVPSKRYKAINRYPVGLKTKLKNFIKSLIYHKSGEEQKKETISVHKASIYDTFNESVKHSKPYCGIDELYSEPPEYDVYITGSDQVWNPTQSYCIEPYFLTFVRSGRKISYASSVGVDNLLSQERKLFAKWLKSYDAISVREQSGCSMLSEITKKHIERVADPTMLIDIEYWDTLAISPNCSNYILLFTLERDENQLEYARLMSRQSGKTLIVLQAKGEYQQCEDFKLIDTPTIEQWLGFIKNADMVLTDSFHCTLFAILLGSRNFYTYISPNSNRGSRIIDLFNTFGIQCHLLSPELNQRFNDLEANQIDRDLILRIYKKEQRISRNFLSANLS